MLSAAIQVLTAYVLVDLLTGLYHFTTDRGWNFEHQVRLFQRHHDTNTMDELDWQPSVIGLPALLLGLWLNCPFLIAGGWFGIFSQVPHYYAHRRSDLELVHHVVRIMQLSGLIISPKHHARHHNGVFDHNFCILSGWNNGWLNHFVSPRDR